jgi:hypothetical protein
MFRRWMLSGDRARRCTPCSSRGVLHAFADQRLGPGCSARLTPSALAAHWRVWSSGVAPMPPVENTRHRRRKRALERGCDALR